MCQRCDAALAAIESDAVTLELDALEHELDVTAGLIPPWATRAMFPHERRARVNFAQLAAQVDRHTDRLIELVTGHRARIADAIEGRLRTADTTSQLTRIVAGIADPARSITADVAGYRALTAEVQAQAQATLEAAYREARATVRAEAIAQGVPHEALDVGYINRRAAAAIAARAQTVADAPGRVVTQAVAQAALRQPTAALPVAQAADELAAAARNDLHAGLVTDGARVPAQQVAADGRVTALGDLPAAANYYASELLDGNTCDPCSLIDGTSYATLEEADADYGSGTYSDCEGGDRCRGTLVTVWDTESDPTVNDVGGDGSGDGPDGGDSGDPAPPPPPADTSPRAQPDASPTAAADTSTRSTLDPTINNFGTGAQADRARALIADVDRLHGVVAADGFDPIQWRYGYNKGGGKGGHYSPAARGPKPRRKSSETSTEYRDRLRAYRASATAPEILINDGAVVPADIATLHEFGHRLDSLPYQRGDLDARFWTKATRPTVDYATRERGYSAVTADMVAGNDALASALNGFFDAVTHTDHYRLINDPAARISPENRAYLRSPHEVWARAYSQWAANGIGGTARDTLATWGPTAPELQWADADFATVSPWVADILNALGHTLRP